MCMTPSMPHVPAPVAPQQAPQKPDIAQVRLQNPLAPLTARMGSVGDGLLTGASGVAPGSLNLGVNKALGGGK